LSDADSTIAPRALGVVDSTGKFALVGVTTNQYGGNNMRSGTTDGRGNYWGAGATSGTFYFGDDTPATVQNTVKNTVVIQDLEGNLYFSTSKTTPGIWEIPGTPIGAATPELVFQSPTGKPYGFAFNTNFTIAYVADDTTGADGGIQRWDRTAGNWSLSYAFDAVTNSGARCLAVDFTGAHPIIYATTAEDSANRLVSVTDTGAASPAVILATAGANQLFRGVAFTPQTSSEPECFNPVETTNGFTLSWTALINRSYTVQYSENLSGNNWITLTNVTATAPVLTITDAGVPGATERFYRVILNP
jgi:hypothetical protein